MGRALINPDNSLWRNAVGVGVVAIVVPIAIFVKLITMPFERPRKRTPQEVTQFLRGFIDDSDGEWDWDEFTSTPLADPALESIRQRAASIVLPISEEGRRTLRALLVEAEACASAKLLS